MQQQHLDLDGLCAGPLFAPLIKERAPRLRSGYDGSRRIWGMIRRRAERQATPAWADKALTRDLFKLARIYTQALGVRYSVDHEIPLTSPWVCGLHVPANMRVLPLLENTAKGNAWAPEEQLDLL